MITPETAKKRYIARWKREHRRKAHYGNCLRMAYNVPGTPESGVLAMLLIAKPALFPADGGKVR